MCLALYKPAKAKLRKRDMAEAFIQNPDGAGFAFFDPTLRKVVIQRGYFDFDDLWRDMVAVMADNVPMIVHFRWATHGAVDTDNCHPFPIKDGALIHNGIIECATNSAPLYGMGGKVNDALQDPRSDTRIFVEDFIAEMGAHELKLSRAMIEHLIDWSKIVTLHNDGTVLIFNEHKGHWDRGVWYSNDSYKPTKRVVIGKSGKAYDQSIWDSWDVGRSSTSNWNRYDHEAEEQDYRDRFEYGRLESYDEATTYQDVLDRAERERLAMLGAEYAGDLTPDMPEYAG